MAETCTYPKCNCPFDAPADPNWCARGLPHEHVKQVTLPSYMQRVVAEKEELDTKLLALRQFIVSPLFHGLSGRNADLLLKQQTAMHQYSTILMLRIKEFQRG